MGVLANTKPTGGVIANTNPANWGSLVAQQTSRPLQFATPRQNPATINNTKDLQSALKTGAITKDEFAQRLEKLTNSPTKAGSKYTVGNIAGSLKDAVNNVLIKPAVNTAKIIPNTVSYGAAQATHNQPAIQKSGNALQSSAGGSLISPLANVATMLGTNLAANKLLSSKLTSPEVKQAQLREAINPEYNKTGFDINDSKNKTRLKGALLVAEAAATPILNKGLISGPGAVAKSLASRLAVNDTKATVKNAATSSLLGKLNETKPITKPTEPTTISSDLKSRMKFSGKPITSQTSPTPKTTQTSTKPIEAPIGNKTSGVAKNIEARAIEKKLSPTTGFDELATFNSKTHAEENAKVANLITTDPEKAIRIAQGHERLPSNIEPSKLLQGLEEHANTLPKDEGAALVRDLGKSKLATIGSEHGSGLSMQSRRNPNSAIAHIQSILDARKAAAEKTLKGIPLDKHVSTTVKEIKSSVPSVKRQDWHSFTESLRCK